MKKFIVITSIFPPTEAIERFSELNEYQLIVVGDKKTPQNWSYPNVIFLSVDDNLINSFELSTVLPYNHYCRKMLGYLYAIKNGADVIVDTDDDNIPKEDWAFPDFVGNYLHTEPNRGFINIYNYYTKQQIWPRGLPLNLINTKNSFDNLTSYSTTVGIWQGIADEDPDVDAVYRLTSDQVCYFETKPPLVLAKGTVTPFNTQNTIIIKELYPLMYLPAHVTFRFTDILRGLIAQPIMWLYNYQLGFTNATVIQKRNPHDYFKDFISEIPMYQHCENVVGIVESAINKDKSICDNLYEAYRALHKAGIVNEKEFSILDAWLKDVTNL